MDNVLFVPAFDSLGKFILGVFAVVGIGGTAEDAAPETRIYAHVNNILTYEQYNNVCISLVLIL